MTDVAADLIEDAGVVAEDAPRERLHPLTLFTGLAPALRGAWGALLASAYFIAQGQRWVAIAIVSLTLVGSLASIAVRYFSFSYRVEEDEIDMASGVFSRNQRSIPFDRIQDVNVEQGLLHRLVGLAKVKFETGASAGANDDDGSLDSITLARADALRDLIRAHRSGERSAVATPAEGDAAPAVAAGAPVIFAMSRARLVRLAIYSFSLAIVGALFGVLQTYGDALGIDIFERSFWRDRIADSGPLRDYVFDNRWLTVLFGIVSLSLAGFVTGFVKVIPRDWNFTLQRGDTGFRRKRGLFTLTDVVVPLKRVQAAIVGTGPIRRRSGYYEMKVQSLGRDSGSGDHMLAPLATSPEIAEIFHSMDWRTFEREGEWHRPSRGFVWSGIAVAIGWLLPLAIALAALVHFADADIDAPAALRLGGTALAFAAPFLLLLPIALFRWLDYRHRRYRLEEDRLLSRTGWWRQRLVVLPLGKVQSADVTRNLVDRLFAISHLKLGVAGGSGFSSHGVAAIPHAAAYALRERILEPVR